MTPVMEKPLPAEASALIIRSLMNDRQIKDFEATNECNFAISPPGIGRFRVNAFVQQGRVGGVLRTITTDIPTFEQLGLPQQLSNIVMEKRGLVLMVGATGRSEEHTSELQSLMRIACAVFCLKKQKNKTTQTT